MEFKKWLMGIAEIDKLEECGTVGVADRIKKRGIEEEGCFQTES